MDEKAQVALEYAIILSIAVTIMTLVILLFNGLITDASKQATEAQFNGLGNQLSNTINDMYLSKCSNVSRTFSIPFQIGDRTFGIEANATDYFNRTAIRIYSSDVEVFAPLNIPNVTGTASSLNTTKLIVTKRGDEIRIANKNK